MTLTRSDNILLEKTTAVVLVRAEKGGVPWYYYVAVKSNELLALQKALLEQRFDPEAWHVLRMGAGEPYEELKREMLEKYGCQSDGGFPIA